MSDPPPARYADFPHTFYSPYSDLNGIAPPTHQTPYTSQLHANTSNTPQRTPLFDPTASMRANQHPQVPLGHTDAGARTPALSTSSVRPRALDTDDIGDDEERATKKLKSMNEKVTDVAGAHFGVMHDMYRDIRKAIQLRLKHGPHLTAPLTTIDVKLHSLGCALFKILPDVHTRIVAGGDTGLATLSAALHSTRKSVHSTFVNLTKNAISNWHPFEPQLDSVSKDFRGFHHPGTGSLLCPADLDYSKEAVREGLKNCEYTKYPIGPEHFPQYLWPAGTDFQDDAALISLIFRSDWILKAVTLFLYGPEAAAEIKADSIVFGARTHSSKARAVTWGLEVITPACIALAAVMVRHALSDQKTFHVGDMREFRAKTKAKIKTGGNSWPYKTFYHLLIDYIENTMTEAQRTSLLDWFTRKVIGHEYENPDDLNLEEDGDDGSMNNPSGRMSTLARLRLLSGPGQDEPVVASSTAAEAL